MVPAAFPCSQTVRKPQYPLRQAGTTAEFARARQRLPQIVHMRVVIAGGHDDASKLAFVFAAADLA